MVKWNSIDQLREIFINKYINSNLQSELEKACSEEYELKRDYNGRQILELLQNVDDACDCDKSQEDVIVNISFKDGVLEVGNTGTTFSAESIERLCLGRASEKNSQKIGNKGTGFRSLLNDAEWIEIHSGEFSVRFSEKFTQEIFDCFCDKESSCYSELIYEQSLNWKKDYPFCFPIMNCPEKIESDSKGFDTLIRVKVKEGNESKDTSISKQLEQPFYKSLLFLPNITKIIVDTNTSYKEYYKVSYGDEAAIEEKGGGELLKEEDYFVFSKDVHIGGKNADLIIAIPKDTAYDFSNEKLYCYFPIRGFTTPLHALIHAPFITNNSRDDVPNDNEQINKELFLAVFAFIKEIAEKDSVQGVQGLSIKTVTPVKKSMLWNSGSFNLESKYLENLIDARILPTVTKEFISIKDGPKLFKFSFPEEFYQKSFSDLIIDLSEECKSFICELAAIAKISSLEYTDKELCHRINDIPNRGDEKIGVKIFIWWSDHFKDSLYLPELLKDANKDWILKKNRVYLPTDDGISSLPDELSWAELCILEQKYVAELISQLKLKKKNEWEKSRNKYISPPSDKRILGDISRLILAVDLTEQSSADMIVSSINQQIDSFEKSKSFIKWFFEKYGENLKEGSELSKIRFRLPSNQNDIKPINDLYLITDNNKPIAERLFRNTSKKEIAPIASIYNAIDSEKFVLFLKKCTILEYPEIKEESLANNDGFKKYVKEKYNFHINLNYLYSKAPENFEDLIRNLDTKEIVEWLSKDEKLKNLITSQESGSYAKQQSNWSETRFDSNAYVKYVLNNTPWIKFGEKKYPPCRIIKYDRIKQQVDGYYGVSEQELINYLGRDIVLFFNLDFKDSIAQLPDEGIKTFLDRLPIFDGGEISRKLYLDIIKLKRDTKPSFSIANINVLAKDGLFYPNNEVKYADRKVSKAESEAKKFMYIPAKQSTETIKAWFGVERYKTKLKLESYVEIEEKKEFANEIKDIKIAIMSIIESTKKNVDALKRLEIIPCSYIEVSDIEQENKKMILEDCFFVEKGNLYFLKVPEDFNITAMRQLDAFAQSMVDIFKQALTLELDSDRVELLVSKDSRNKQEKIQDLYGVDKWNASYEMLYNKKHENELIYNFFSENNLDSDLLLSVSKIDFTENLLDDEYEILIQSLKKISKDIDEINKCLETIEISLIPFFEIQIKKLMDREYRGYRVKIYEETKKNKDYACFLEKIEKYKNFNASDFHFRNSINTDVTEILQQDFPVLKNEIHEDVDPDEKYNFNTNEIIQKLGITQENFDFFIQNHKSERSSLYFEIPLNIYDQIKEFLAKKDLNIIETPENGDNGETSTIKVKLVKVPPTPIKTSRRGKTEDSEEGYKQKNQQNDSAGKEAENIAYAELKKQYKNLIWHSKYSKNKAGRNNPPPNGVVCDMWDCDPQKGNTFFEVKSSVTEFEMTINEYKSMERNKSNYEVVLVNRDTREISRHKFAEIDELKRVNSYKFKFKQEKNE